MRVTPPGQKLYAIRLVRRPMRGSVSDSPTVSPAVSPTVLEPTGHATDADLDADDAVYPDETGNVTDQSVTRPAKATPRWGRLHPSARLRAVLVSTGVLVLVLLV